LYDKYLGTSQICVISGIRRSGKSTLLAQFSKKVNNFYFINFDDERLADFSVEDFRNLMITFQKLYKSKTVFLDEIQNVEGWERFVRRIHDEGYKVFITGSNAKLLSSELATHLTGRYIKLELYPFSFKEFLQFNKIDYKKRTSANQAKVFKQFKKYLEEGGFPEYLEFDDPEYLKRVYDDILYKDLLVRFKIKEVKAFKQLAAFLFTNFTKEISYNSLKKTLGFKSTTSVKNYVEFMQESFLIFELYKYDFSLKKQFVSDKKIFAIDNGLRNIVSFYFSKDSGRLLENLVFIELKRQGKEVYYYKNKGECDFLVKEKSKIVSVVQVSKYIEKGLNERRELGGLIEAMKKFELKEGVILTESQEEIIKKDGFIINVMPTWKWLLK
jgi:predicted AAA+ superfamily ATPase